MRWSSILVKWVLSQKVKNWENISKARLSAKVFEVSEDFPLAHHFAKELIFAQSLLWLLQISGEKVKKQKSRPIFFILNTESLKKRMS